MVVRESIPVDRACGDCGVIFKPAVLTWPDLKRDKCDGCSDAFIKSMMTAQWRAKPMSMTNDAEAVEQQMNGSILTELQFTKRFADHYLKQCGFTHFDDGSSVDEYCGEVAKSYYQDPHYRDEGPEACAESDMDYWGEE